ncbi:MAG: ATP-binding cassette domain-containing protein, partial [Lachnospiraceae bacterium]|nr:ATP-binding cassette domain-containing protein [Lachnospiraceae bacterium]
DHILGDNSSTISGGERQRLCIIRELMKEPDILILDECTSHLDSESERRIFDVVQELATNMIVIQVAHRPSALAYSDVVYVVDNGQAVASGKHSYLMQSSLFYQKLLASMRDAE